MKTSELSFADGFLSNKGKIAKSLGKPMMIFDWDKASKIIKEKLINHKDLIAEAGLEGDWNYTGGVIFQDGKPFLDDYTYLASNWATPTLVLSWDGEEQEEIECFTDDKSRFDYNSKWDNKSLKILKL